MLSVFVFNYANAEVDWNEYTKIPYDKSTYAKCILSFAKQNVKIESEIENSCQILSIPKKCRNFSENQIRLCVEECSKSSFISRKIGDCSLN